jgi:hypothetical protein
MSEKQTTEALLSHESAEVFLASLGLPVGMFSIHPIMLSLAYTSNSGQHLSVYESHSGVGYELVPNTDDHSYDCRSGSSYDCLSLYLNVKKNKCKDMRLLQNFPIAAARKALLMLADILGYEIIASVKYIGFDIDVSSYVKARVVVGSGLKRR